MSLEQRINTLAELPDGWFDGEEGSALNPDGVAWLKSILLHRDFDALPDMPNLGPTFEGNIEAFWCEGKIPVYLEFDLTKFQISYAVGDCEATRPLDYDPSMPWKAVLALLWRCL